MFSVWSNTRYQHMKFTFVNLLMWPTVIFFYSRLGLGLSSNIVTAYMYLKVCYRVGYLMNLFFFLIVAINCNWVLLDFYFNFVTGIMHCTACVLNDLLCYIHLNCNGTFLCSGPGLWLKLKPSSYCQTEDEGVKCFCWPNVLNKTCSYKCKNKLMRRQKQCNALFFDSRHK